MSKENPFVRIPGSARRYINPATGETISREKYEKTYGRLRPYGSFHRQAKINRQREGVYQTLKPARGRTKARVSEQSHEALLEAQRRAESQLLQAAERKAQARAKRKIRTPAKITLRNFQPGRKGRRFECPFDYFDIQLLLGKGKDASKIILGYTVGIVLEDTRDHSVTGATLTPMLRDINMPYTEDDFLKAVDYISERKSYLRVISAFVYFALKREAFEKLSKRKKPK